MENKPRLLRYRMLPLSDEWEVRSGPLGKFRFWNGQPFETVTPTTQDNHFTFTAESLSCPGLSLRELRFVNTVNTILLPCDARKVVGGFVLSAGLFIMSMRRILIIYSREEKEPRLKVSRVQVKKRSFMDTALCLIRRPSHIQRCLSKRRSRFASDQVCISAPLQ